jgi:transcriptional regulator with XRE-family HTH domain
MPETCTLHKRSREEQLKYTGEQLRKFREAKKLTVLQLARKAGVTKQMIYHCEKAENSISLENYKYICMALELPKPPLL